MIVNTQRKAKRAKPPKYPHREFKRDEVPLLNNPSPSPFKERGIKGVRLPNKNRKRLRLISNFPNALSVLQAMLK